MATTHILDAAKAISALALASGDTIELDGHDLIIDTNALAKPVTLANHATTARMVLENGGGIGLNATLPESICPWVDPENPLPESNYTAGLTANASAEIQLLGNFSLGGGPASLPTATRAGAFWAIVVGSNSTTTLQFDRDFPLHAGDYIVNLTIYNAIQKVRVAAYDAATRTATLESAPSRRTAGDTWSLLAGGVCINRPSTSAQSATWVNAPMRAGTLVFFSGCTANVNNGTIFENAVVANRVLWGAAGGIGGGANNVIGYSCLACALVRQLACGKLYHTTTTTTTSSSSSLGEVVAVNFSYSGQPAFYKKNVVSGPGRFAGTVQNNLYGSGEFVFANTTFNNLPTVFDHAQARLINCALGDTPVGEDITLLSSGTVSRVARSDFPTDTDLPDAFYFAPATASDVPWRYEDYWVRKGETLRLSCRAMRGGDNGAARVAIGEMAIWVPTEGMPTLAEWFLDSGEPLVWRGGQIAWTNDTGEDRQVRVWSMASGIHGAYIRVWRATGGAM